MGKKYSVNDTVWIATALMAAEQYSQKSDVTKEEMFLNNPILLNGRKL